MAPPTIPIEQRFHEKYRVDSKSGCWIWTASLRANGYSQFRYSRGRNGYGHVFSYEHFNGELEPGTQVHHKCENRACVNPDHLEAVSPQENIDYASAHNANKTHCKRGHELAGENLYENPSGKRVCRSCMKLAQEQWRSNNREHYRAYHREYQRRKRTSS